MYVSATSLIDTIDASQTPCNSVHAVNLADTILAHILIEKYNNYNYMYDRLILMNNDHYYYQMIITQADKMFSMIL